MSRSSSRRVLRAARALAAAAACLACAAGLLAAEVAPAPPAAVDVAAGGEQTRVAARALVGGWSSDVGAERMSIRLGAGGDCQVGETSGTYTVEPGAIRMRIKGSEVVYQFRFDARTLVLTGGDIRGELRLLRQPDPVGYLGQLFDVSGASFRRRGLRLLVIIAAAAIARAALTLLKLAWRFVIVSQWGPLRYLYRRSKNRALTISALALNVAKYAVYLITIGVLLSELGINYMAYIASLSVLGLAVAFGSQGLVQDMVTGLSILLEEQFEVGDMVEISGQTGVVEDLGLRMTKLRTRQGALIVIPNRNIAVVARYSGGGLHAVVDVAVDGAEAAAKAAETVSAVATEVASQFGGAVVSGPEAASIVELATGEVFVRVAEVIWPGQQWVIDNQLVPRIKEALASAGIAIPADRIAVFYRPGERGRRSQGHAGRGGAAEEGRS